MRTVYLVLMLALMAGACSSDDKKDEVTPEENSLLNTSSTSPSVGELHNQGLDAMYLYLSNTNDLDADNIHNYSKKFLETNYDEEASDYYSLAIDGFDFYSTLSEEFNNEINYLHYQLDEGIIDFNNFNDFSVYMYNYKTQFIYTEDDIEAWNVYVDIFIHSLNYWSTNLDKWRGLLNQGNNQVFTDEKKCKDGSWLKRAWCNTKKYIAADAGAGVSSMILALAASNPIVFGAVAGTSLGASGAAVIKDLITGDL